MGSPALLRPGRLLLILVGGLALAAPVAAQPAGFTMSGFTGGFGFSNHATGMAWAPDGSNQLFVTLQKGDVWVLEYAGNLQTRRSWVFARITPVFENAESGLVGMAFDPAFTENHYVYFLVTVSPTEQQIVRYTSEDGIGKNKTVLVSGLPTVGIRHNGGALQFGTDGLLYFGVGDNGEWVGVADDLSSLASKIGRVHPDGTVPNDNPFFDGTGPNADLIWARGFRNPFSITMDPITGALWVDAAGEAHEQVFSLQRGGHAGWDLYEDFQPAGYMTPVFSHPSYGSTVVSIADGGAMRSGGIATFVTTDAHGLHKGEEVTIAGVADASFDGTAYVASASGPAAFSVVSAGPDTTSGGGTATKHALANCVLGGTFYDATQFPAEFRGNYFFAGFGDGSGSRILRAGLSGPQDVASIGFWWGFPVGPLVDLEVGPDGALYAMFLNSEIVKLRANVATQQLVLSNQHVWIPQESARAISVSLATNPGANVVVSATRLNGASSIQVSPSTLTFTPLDWDVPKPLMLSAAADASSALTTAYIELSAPGLTSEGVTVHGVGSAPNAFVVSAGMLTVAEGQSGAFTVALANAPSAPVTLDLAVTSGGTQLAIVGTTTLVFTSSDFATPQGVIFDTVDDPALGDLGATLQLTAPGFEAREVTVRILDDEPMAPRITSYPQMAAGEGILYTYSVTSTGRPVPTYSLDKGPSGMSIDATTGVLSWTPTDYVSYNSVTVRASNGVAPDAVQAFVVNAGMFSCGVRFPPQAATLGGNVDFTAYVGTEGSNAEPVETQFLIDGITSYVETSPRGNPQFGGVDWGWDTTAVANGEHSLGVRSLNSAGQTCEGSITVTVNNPDPIDAGTDAGSSFPPDSGSAPDGGADAGSDAAPSDDFPDSGDVSSAEDAGLDGAHVTPGDSGADAMTGAPAGHPTPAGCGCRLAPTQSSRAPAPWISALVAIVWRSRRRRARAA